MACRVRRENRGDGIDGRLLDSIVRSPGSTGFEVHLANPRATKHISGRKSDVLEYRKYNRPGGQLPALRSGPWPSKPSDLRDRVWPKWRRFAVLAGWVAQICSVEVWVSVGEASAAVPMSGPTRLPCLKGGFLRGSSPSDPAMILEEVREAMAPGSVAMVQPDAPGARGCG